MKDKTEQILIEQLRNGSRNAFNQIYQMYSRRLYSYCLTFTKSNEDSKDIVQTVFIKLWMNRSSLELRDSISSLLFTIAKNDLINAYKKGLNSNIYEEYILYKDAISTNEVSEKVEYKDYLDCINKCLNKLPEKQKQIIILSRFEGLSNKEIANMLNLSEQTVKNNVSMGIKRLKNMLDKCFYFILIFLLVN